MENIEPIKNIVNKYGLTPINIEEKYPDETHIGLKVEDFKSFCLACHKELASPVMMMFGEDSRHVTNDFKVHCVFLSAKYKKFYFITTSIDPGSKTFDSLSREVYSSNLFERQIKEMFGIEAIGAIDLRRLHLHNEVWPEGAYPMLKDFVKQDYPPIGKEYVFNKIEGEGIFEIPVGPVHAGIIGPGHFRFSVAGEPIINLETRLGFTHRGIEKIFEGKTPTDAVELSQCISGDSAFAYSFTFCSAIEKICGISVPQKQQIFRMICLELERLYNHVSDVGGMALDVGFSFPSNFASIIKENILRLNDKLTNSRYLKGINIIGGTSKTLLDDDISPLTNSLALIEKDFNDLKDMMLSNASFMDRVEGTGILRRKTAEDLGITGVSARATGLSLDLRKTFPKNYDGINFNVIKQSKGDVLARLNVRIGEFQESINMIRQFLNKLKTSTNNLQSEITIKEGYGLGYVEAWRGALLMFVKINKDGKIERCNIVDPSFHNWQALTFAVIGNIVPDFPLCNKSFDLSYAGNDL